MAELVCALGTSHTPQLSAPPAIWPEYARRDERNPELLGTDGAFHTYEELAALRPPVDDRELSLECRSAKHERAQVALERLGAQLAEAAPDVVVIVGDDQDELFRDGTVPTIAVYSGDGVVERPPTGDELARIPTDVQAALWAFHGTEPERYPTAPDLGTHLLERLTAAGFDPANVTTQRDDRTLGHAFTFVRRRVMRGEPIPMVPVAINTYYPPNQPSPARCLALGRALRDAIASWRPARVALVASGGLSHFVVDEDLDRRVLDAIVTRSVDDLATLPTTHLRSGTSEILNWITVAGAAEQLEPDVIDYIPAYRSPAGTGVGMAFTRWT